MKTKKAISEIMTISLILLVLAGAFIGTNSWLNTFNSNLVNKFESKDTGKVEIISIKNFDTNKSIVVLKKYSKKYEVISQLKLNGQDCFMYSSNVIERVSYIYSNCSFPLLKPVKIDVFTENGIYSKTLSVLE